MQKRKNKMRIPRTKWSEKDKTRLMVLIKAHKQLYNGTVDFEALENEFEGRSREAIKDQAKALG